MTKILTEKEVSKYKLGDRVVSDFNSDEKNIVRKITIIVKSGGYGSNYQVSADGGENCRCCGRAGTPIHRVDGAWFEKVEIKKKV